MKESFACSFVFLSYLKGETLFTFHLKKAMTRVKSEDSPLYGRDLEIMSDILDVDTKILDELVKTLRQYEAQRWQLSGAGGRLLNELLGDETNLDTPVELQKRLQRLLSS